jgi:hypothetical protein
LEFIKYSKEIIPHLKEIDYCYPLFWKNPDKLKGFRITDIAFELMIDRGYKKYSFFVKKITSTDLILMDQKITYPWSLSGLGSLTFFYEPIALAMVLSNNNIETSIKMVYE